jgi:hypothetical protein
MQYDAIRFGLLQHPTLIPSTDHNPPVSSWRARKFTFDDVPNELNLHLSWVFPYIFHVFPNGFPCPPRLMLDFDTGYRLMTGVDRTQRLEQPCRFEVPMGHLGDGL